MNSKEENSEGFCPNYVQEFGLGTGHDRGKNKFTFLSVFYEGLRARSLKETFESPNSAYSTKEFKTQCIKINIFKNLFLEMGK